MRLRRSSKLLFFDPYTLVVSPDRSSPSQKSTGLLYLDDETTLAHEQSGAYAVRTFTYERVGSTASLKCTTGDSITTHGVIEPDTYFAAPNYVERVVIAGQKSPPTVVNIRAASQDQESSQVEFIFSAELATLTLKNPRVLVSGDWEIVMLY
jgi:hypothetical protein